MTESRQVATSYPELAGRVAVVTGAGHGMGRAHSELLAAEGVRVLVADIDARAAREVAEKITRAGGTAIACACDVSRQGEVEATVQAAADAFGGIDIVVSNAGIVNPDSRLETTDDNEWHRQFSVHVDGAFYLSRATVSWLRRSSAARLIIISSEWGQVPPGYAYGYCAAKAALMNLGKNLALEFAGDGILVNVIAPGTIKTRMLDEPQNLGWTTSSLTIPIGHAAEPEEIATVVAFLASDRASFLTGQVIPVNGGSTMSGI